MLYLASQSPRRCELLRQLGVQFSLVDIAVTELRASDESPTSYVSRVAREKAQAGFCKMRHKPGAVVLGADTEVVLGDHVFGKPATAIEAAHMLAQLSGRTHRVLSVVWLVSEQSEREAVSVSEVTFAELSASAISNYVASGESMGKAGGYAIQGCAARFISHLKGSYSGVMGLPLFETAKLLQEFEALSVDPAM